MGMAPAVRTMGRRPAIVLLTMSQATGLRTSMVTALNVCLVSMGMIATPDALAQGLGPRSKPLAMVMALVTDTVNTLVFACARLATTARHASAKLPTQLSTPTTQSALSVQVATGTPLSAIRLALVWISPLAWELLAPVTYMGGAWHKVSVIQSQGTAGATRLLLGSTCGLASSASCHVRLTHWIPSLLEHTLLPAMAMVFVCRIFSLMNLDQGSVIASLGMQATRVPFSALGQPQLMSVAYAVAMALAT
mmetsp:Transcript_126331/g.218900  ORF Transcript_126331/g.218900 Transcript_126331/m.218900 type:complete len:250 (-) Transcript_126331:6766-7515(-)